MSGQLAFSRPDRLTLSYATPGGRPLLLTMGGASKSGSALSVIDCMVSGNSSRPVPMA